MKRFLILLSTILILISVILPFTTVSAIDPPTSIVLTSVNAYQDCLETGDMLFLGYGAINYGTYPTDYAASDTFLLRLFDTDGTTELASTVLYSNPYFHLGYGKFIQSFYFSATEVTSVGLVWNSAYTVKLSANPAISWNGTAPTPATVVPIWSGTGQANRIIYIVSQLQSSWGVSLIDSGTLTEYGEDYIVAVIPYARYLAPTIFASYTTTPVYHERSKNWFTYAITLRNQWIGTWMDLTDIATLTSIPAGWLYAGIWLVVMATIIFFAIEGPSLATNTGLVVPQAKNSKMIFYLVIILVAFGGITGFLPYLSTLLIGFILVLILINQIFFQKSYG